MAMFPILAMLLIAGGVGLGLTADYKLRSQSATDRARRWYRVTFPSELSYDSVLAFVNALSGLHRPRGLGAIPTFVFEVEADEKGTVHRLGVPRGQEAFVLSQLRTLIPSAHAVLETANTNGVQKWDYALELKLRDPRMPLRTDNPENIVASILTGFHPLKAGEALKLQWVVAPNQTLPLPHVDDNKTSWPFGPLYESKDRVAQRRKKLESTTYIGIGRIAACSTDEGEAAKLAHTRLFTPLNSTRTHDTRFVRRRRPAHMVHNRLDGSVGTLPMMLSARELATFISFPIGSPNVAGMPNGRSRQLPAANTIPTEGIIAAISNYPGAERPLAIDPVSMRHHQWILGPTGVGKSTLIENEVAQIMEQGFGMVLIEPKGDLAEDVLKSVPGARKQDVIWFDPTDTARPIGLNVLSGPDPERTTGHVVALFKSIYSDSWGARLEMILRYSVLTAAIQGLTLYDVKQLLLNSTFRAEVVKQIKDPDIRQFWKSYEEYPDNAKDSVINKLDSFLGSRAIRNIIGQVDGISMAQVIRENKILIVPMPSGVLGDANAAMLGSLMFVLFWQEIRAVEAAARKPFFLVLDEWQTLINNGIPIDDLFAIARGLQLGLIVANQHTGQLKPSVLSSVANNARTKVAFGMAPEDAKKMADQFPPFTAYDLQRLGQHEVVIQAMTPDGLAPAATATTLPPPRPTGFGEDARTLSRAKYGQPVDEVEAGFASKHVVPDKPSRPRFGTRDE